MRAKYVVAVATIAIIAASTLLPGNAAQADELRDKQWHLSFLRVAAAHRITMGKGVTVGVVDSGVDPHRDLSKNLLRGTDLTPGEGDDGRVDSSGHGTEMAGLIAAHGRSNNDGVLGLAPMAKILPVKYSSELSNGNSRVIAQGIEWASAHGAQVINVSSAVGPSLALNKAIDVATANDALVVAGSGNRPDFVNFGYPAAMVGVLSVGAIDRSGKHAPFSISGPAMQICAPGVDIESTLPNDEYSIAWGTSGATAIVSGAAALVRAKYPNLSAQQVIHRLTATATDIGKPGRDDECGFGVLNVVKALTADVPLPANSDPGTGSAGPTAAPTADAAPSAGGDAPAPDGSAAGSNTPMVVGGAVAVIVLLGGLLALLAARRRRSNS